MNLMEMFSLCVPFPILERTGQTQGIPGSYYYRAKK